MGGCFNGAVESGKCWGRERTGGKGSEGFGGRGGGSALRCLGMGGGTSETLPPFDSNNWGSILTGSGGSGSELVEPVLGGFFRFTGIGSISLAFLVLGSGGWRRGRGGKRREEVGRTLGKGLGGRRIRERWKMEEGGGKREEKRRKRKNRGKRRIKEKRKDGRKGSRWE